jgi:hypothetical protein
MNIHGAELVLNLQDPKWCQRRPYFETRIRKFGARQVGVIANVLAVSPFGWLLSSSFCAINDSPVGEYSN